MDRQLLEPEVQTERGENATLSTADLAASTERTPGEAPASNAGDESGPLFCIR